MLDRQREAGKSHTNLSRLPPRRFFGPHFLPRNPHQGAPSTQTDLSACSLRTNQPSPRAVSRHDHPVSYHISTSTLRADHGNVWFALWNFNTVAAKRAERSTATGHDKRPDPEAESPREKAARKDRTRDEERRNTTTRALHRPQRRPEIEFVAPLERRKAPSATATVAFAGDRRTPTSKIRVLISVLTRILDYPKRERRSGESVDRTLSATSSNVPEAAVDVSMHALD